MSELVRQGTVGVSQSESVCVREREVRQSVRE